MSTLIERYSLFEKRVPRYGWLHAGKGLFLKALYDRYSRNPYGPESSHSTKQVAEIAGVTRQLMALGPEHRQNIAKAIKLIENYFENIGLNLTREAKIDPAWYALRLLKENTTTPEALKRFLKRVETFPHKFVFDPRFSHHLFGTHKVTGHYNLAEVRKLGSVKIKSLGEFQESFEEDGIDVVDPVSLREDEATITHGAVIQHSTTYVPVKRIVKRRKWGIIPIEVEKIEHEKKHSEVHYRQDGEKQYAIRLNFADYRVDKRRGSHTAYTLILPESEYRSLLPRVKRNPLLMAEMYNAAFPWHSENKKFKKGIVIESMEQMHEAFAERQPKR